MVKTMLTLVGATLAVLLTLPGGAYATPAPTAGVLWFNTLTGDMEEWLLNGTTHVVGSTVWSFHCSTASGCYPRWKMVGVADMDADGISDLVIYSASTAEVAVPTRPWSPWRRCFRTRNPPDQRPPP
jgi:hypothetical protein